MQPDTSSENIARALDVLRELATGTLDRNWFTDDATWWSNRGQTFLLGDFLELIGSLHNETIGGIVIRPGLVIDGGNAVVIEATSHIPLVSGKTYANRYLFLLHFNAGLIREVREYNDTAHVAECFDIP